MTADKAFIAGLPTVIFHGGARLRWNRRGRDDDGDVRRWRIVRPPAPPDRAPNVQPENWLQNWLQLTLLPKRRSL